jgi:hypothetical protein
VARMKYLCYSILILFIATIMLSCSSGASSPEDLGEKVVNTLKNNDVESYLKFCGSTNDLVTLLKKADISDDEKKEEIKKAQERLNKVDKESEKDRREDFADTYVEHSWSTAEVDHVELGEIRDRDGITYYKDIHVYLVGGTVLEIDAVVKTPRGWIIMDNRPLHIN